MEISEDKKVEFLLEQLKERYEALHKMRDRSMQFSLWILGFGLGLAWLLINENEITFNQKIAISIVLIAVFILTMYFVKAIGYGFDRNRKIMIRLEKALKLFDIDFYEKDKAILPETFKSEKKSMSGHFKTLCTIIVVVFILLMALTWANPCKNKLKTDCSFICTKVNNNLCK